MTEPPCAIDDAAVAALAETRVDWRFKGWPADGRTIAELSDAGLHALCDLAPPVLLLREPALERNLRGLADWCAAHGVLLAPHGKTTMAPQLFARQIALGAWAITVASVAQARVCRRFGVSRVLIANELATAADAAWVAQALRADPAFELLCVADSPAGVKLLAAAAAAACAGRPLPVLVEVGYDGGRGGCRTPAQIAAVRDAVHAAPALRLAGVEAYEGLAASERDAAGLATVDAFLERVAGAVEQLAPAFDWTGPLVSAGGSAFFDRVAALLAAPAAAAGARLVLRSGCYATHDHGLYARLAPSAADGGVAFEPALEAWAPVLSRPEADRAVLGAGRRDLPFDAGLPTPLRRFTRDAALVPAAGMTVVALNDQHAHVQLATDAALAAGDLVGLGLSHPCTAFDRWPLVALVDDDLRVTGAVRTFF
jgi:D-serine deaminase-like pyridoxal phosphate-dependent protein